jgi:hypothetical protein
MCGRHDGEVLHFPGHPGQPYNTNGLPTRSRMNNKAASAPPVAARRTECSDLKRPRLEAAPDTRTDDAISGFPSPPRRGQANYAPTEPSPVAIQNRPTSETMEIHQYDLDRWQQQATGYAGQPPPAFVGSSRWASAAEDAGARLYSNQMTTTSADYGAWTYQPAHTAAHVHWQVSAPNLDAYPPHQPVLRSRAHSHPREPGWWYEA